MNRAHLIPKKYFKIPKKEGFLKFMWYIKYIKTKRI